MSQLRRPFGAIQERYGKAGLIISILALVMALGGGAYAASGGLTAKEKKQVKAIAKKYAGKPGKPGAPGPAGPQGSAGQAGAKGDAGSNGTNGTNGEDGEDGKSPTVTSEPAGVNCPDGGVKITPATGAPTYVCNGEDGGAGEPDLPDTLPSEDTLTGAWSFGNLPEAASPSQQNTKGIFIPISFEIPLETELGASEVHFINTAGQEVLVKENTTTFELEIETKAQPTPKPCPGTVAAPEAEPGHLCVYEGRLQGPAMASNLIGSPASEFLWPAPGLNNGTSTTGAILNAVQINAPAPENYGWGTWAVTAA